MLVEEVDGLAKGGDVFLLEERIGEVALGLVVLGIGGGQGAPEGEGALFVDGGLGIFEGAAELGEAFEGEGEVALVEGGWFVFGELFGDLEGCVEMGFRFGVKAELGFYCAEGRFGGGEETGVGGGGGEIVRLPGEREGVVGEAGGGEGRGEALVIGGAGGGWCGGGLEELACGGVVLAGVMRVAGSGGEVGEAFESGGEFEGAGLG